MSYEEEASSEVTKDSALLSSGIPGGSSPDDGGLNKRSSNSDIEMASNCPHVEEEPTHLPLGVEIKHLTKVYSNGKVRDERSWYSHFRKFYCT